jgi:hypothetical protein
MTDGLGAYRRVASLGLLILIMVLAAGLRLVHARGQALWGDEVFSLAMATGHSLEGARDTWIPSLGDFTVFETPVAPGSLRVYLEHASPLESPARVVRAVRISDTSPPLYYVSLWLWTVLAGTRDFVLRCHSIFWALASIPVVWSLARAVGRTRTAVLVCTLFAVLPMPIDASIEVRMYSMLWFWAACLALASMRITSGRYSAGWLCLFAVAAACGMLTHYFFVFILAACGATLLLYPGETGRRRLAIAFAATLMLVAPWYVHLPDMMAGWRVTKDWLTHPDILGETSYRYLFYAVRNSLVVYYGAFPPKVWTTSLVGLTVLYAVAFIYLWPRLPRVSWLLLGAWWLFSSIGPIVLDGLLHSYAASIPRYGYGGIFPALMIAALACNALLGRASIILLGAVVAAYVPALQYLFASSNRGSFFPPAAQIASENAGDDDLIIVHSIPSGFLGLARYSNTSTPMVLWTQQLRRHEGRDGPEQTERDLADLLDGHRKVVLVRVHDVSEPAPELDVLRRKAKLVLSIQPGTAKVDVFEPTGGETFRISPDTP